MTDEQIKEIFLANGFTIKEGMTDLKPYVYQAARALLQAANDAPDLKALPLEREANIHWLRTNVNKTVRRIAEDYAELAMQAASAAPHGTVAVPVEAYLWLMGMGNDGFTEDRDGKFWWRSAFNERAGLDMVEVYKASRAAPPQLNKGEA